MKTTIRIQNFKSLEDVTLELAPTTVFLGPNGAGKSSVLKCLEFVGENIFRVTTSNPKKTKYKLQNDLNLISFANIVNNNDSRQDIVIAINHSSHIKREYENEIGSRNIWIDINKIDLKSGIDSTNHSISQNASWVKGVNLDRFTASEKKKIINLFNSHAYTKSLLKEEFEKIKFRATIKFGNISSDFQLKEISLNDLESNSFFSIIFSTDSNKGVQGKVKIDLNDEILNNIINKINPEFSWSLTTLNQETLQFIIKKLLRENSKSNLFNANRINKQTGKRFTLFSTIATLLIYFEFIPCILANIFNIHHFPSTRGSKSRFQKLSHFKRDGTSEDYFSTLFDEHDIEVYDLWEKSYDLSQGFTREIDYTNVDSKLAHSIQSRIKEVKEIDFGQGGSYKSILYWLRKFFHIQHIYKRRKGKFTEVVIRSSSGSTFRYDQSSSGFIQTFPIISLVFNPYVLEYSYMYVEQPELHIHPGLQHRMAELLVSANSQPNANLKFIIETHSEHLIRGYQLLIAQGKLKPKNIRFYYFNPFDNKTEVTHLNVDKLGNFITPWPNGFFSEASDLSYKLLEEQLKRQK